MNTQNMNTQNMNTQRCGHIAIIGEPNAGKSTLTNFLVGGKVSITSHKVQTTRVSTLGIAISENTQLVLLDTPGIFSPKKTIEKSLVKNAWHTVKDVDVLLLLIDVTAKDHTHNLEIIQKIPKGKTVFIGFNKIDKKPDLNKEELQKKFEVEGSHQKFFWISALKGQGVDTLLDDICNLMPDHPWLYPEEMFTTQPQAIWAAEITREQIYKQLHQELPYEIYVEPESFERFDNGSIKIRQAIIASQESQKGMIIGNKGARIKSIGEQARIALEREMDCRIHLNLFVKVRNNWMEKSSIRKEIGL